jgi:hypothetical protein
VRELDLGRHRRARVWIGSLPAAEYDSAETVSAHVRATAVCQPSIGAVEVYVPVGGTFMYGLLGGRVSPSTASQLRVLAKVSSENGPRFRSAICPTGDDLRVGLPRAYAGAIQAGISTAVLHIGNEMLASADLMINCAVHGKVGSSLAMFTRLTAILVRVLTTLPPSASDEDLIGLFPEVYH